MGPSAVWSYFTKTLDGTKVKCNKCQTILAFNKSTSVMITHLSSKHDTSISKQSKVQKKTPIGCKRRHNEDDTEDNEDSIQIQEKVPKISTESSNSIPTIPTEGSSKCIPPGPMDKCISNATSFSAGGSRDVAVMDALVFMIAKDNLPLSITERVGFKVFSRKLQPLWNIPSEPTVTKNLHAKYEHLREKISNKLTNAESVCLTTDIWTHKHTMRSYLGMTAHYRDGVELRSVEIGVKLLHDRKNIINLRKALREMCNEWGITDDMISGVVSDGGANIKGAIRLEFGNDKHLLCIAHCINGIGQAAIGLYDYKVPSVAEVASIDDSEVEEDDDDHGLENDRENCGEDLKLLLRKLKRIVKFFRSSEVATTELKKIQERSGKKPHQCLVLKQEVRTRWNSCFEMIDRFSDLADTVSRVLMQLKLDRNTKSKVPNMLSLDELEVLNEVKTLLKPLYQATMEVVSEKQVTISKVIPLINALKATTEKMVAATPIGFNLKHNLISLIRDKFSGIEKNRLYAVATILDPRFKKNGFNDPLAMSTCLKYTAQLVAIEIGSSRAEIERIQEMGDLQVDESNDDLWSNFDVSVQSRGGVEFQDVADGYPIELKHFLGISVVPRKLNPNPLSAWEGLKTEFAHVHRVALKFLPIMATSVPCERLFSHAGLIANQQRSRLSGRNLDELVFLRSIDPDIWFE